MDPDRIARARANRAEAYRLIATGQYSGAPGEVWLHRYYNLADAIITDHDRESPNLTREN